MTIYGPGGVGKSELAARISDIGVKPLFLDIERGTNFLNIDRVDDIETWDDLRGAVQSKDLLANYGAVVIDSFTKAEELANAWTIENVPKLLKNGERAKVTSLEDYGWGDGFGHGFNTFLQLLGDLDAVVRQNKWVINICHDCTATVPNPDGEDYLRYEPRMMSTRTVSTRLKIKEWSDHLIYVGYDVYVEKGSRKGVGSGTRTIYPTQQTTCMAKSRDLANPIPYPKGSSDFWKQLTQGAKQ